MESMTVTESGTKNSFQLTARDGNIGFGYGMTIPPKPLEIKECFHLLKDDDQQESVVPICRKCGAKVGTLYFYTNQERKL